MSRSYCMKKVLATVYSYVDIPDSTSQKQNGCDYTLWSIISNTFSWFLRATISPEVCPSLQPMCKCFVMKLSRENGFSHCIILCRSTRFNLVKTKWLRLNTLMDILEYFFLIFKSDYIAWSLSKFTTNMLVLCHEVTAWKRF